MRLNSCLVLLVTAAWAAGTALGADAGAPNTPSVAGTQSVAFLGKQFDLKFHPSQGAGSLYEYYAAGDSPSLWIELVDFRVYAVAANGNAPADFAGRLAADYKKRFPKLNIGLYENKEDHAVMLDYFYPMSTRKEPGKEFLEFDAFKFFSDPVSGRTISFHYAKNIEGVSAARQMTDVAAELKSLRAQVISAMAALPAYRQ